MLIVARNLESLRILVYLAGRPGNEASTRDIADALNLPLAVCRKRTWQLRDAGLVIGARGHAGGVKLAVPPDEIPIGNVVAAIEAQRRNPKDVDLECRSIFDRAVRRFFAELNRMTVRDVCLTSRPLGDDAPQQTMSCGAMGHGSIALSEESLRVRRNQNASHPLSTHIKDRLDTDQ